MEGSATTSWKAALALSGASLLSFLARTFVDYGSVYRELNLEGGALGFVTLFNLGLFGGWVWALVAASHESRRAMFVLLGYSVLLVVFGLATSVSLCPSPCQAAWPVGEIAIWSNSVIGIPTTITVALSLFSKNAGR